MSSACLPILILWTLANMLHAIPPARPHQDDEIYFEEEMTKIDENLIGRKNTYYPKSTNQNSRIKFDDPDRVIFPDEDYEHIPLQPTEDVFKSVLKIDQISSCTEKDIFCENVNTYPSVHLNDMLNKNAILKKIFDKPMKENVARIMDNGRRFLCQSVSKYVIPKIGKNWRNMWKYIVNQHDLVQPVLIEVCRNAGGPCDLIVELPNGYTTQCVQKYTQTRLLSLGSNGKLIVEAFQLPAACACSYRKNYSFLARSGSRFTPIGKNKSNTNR